MLHRLASRMRQLTHALTRRSGDERGSVLVLASISLVVVVGSTALAVDLGHAVTSNRNYQAVADLAALDAVRAISDRKNQANGLSTDQHALKLARESAERNKFDWNNTAAGNSLSLTLGKVDLNTRVFTPKCDAPGTPPGCVADATQINAAKVTVSGRVDWAFMPGDRTYSASAVATAEDVAGMTLGSFLARLDTNKSEVLNGLLQGALGGSVTLDLVSYQGLTNANVTLAELGTELGLTAGGVNELLATEVTLKGLIDATASALTKRGDAASLAAVTPLGALSSATASNLKLKLGDLIAVVQGGGDAAMAANLNVLQMVQMAAVAADGDNFLSLSMPVVIPGVATTTLDLQLLEKPKLIIGPARLDASGQWVTRLKSAQVRARINVRALQLLSVVSLLGTGTGPVDIPVYLEGGSATAALTKIQCAANKAESQVTVHVEPQTVHAYIGTVTTADLQDTSTSVSVTPGTMANVSLLGVPLVQVTGSAHVVSAGTPSDLVFTMPGPWPNWTNTKTAGSTTLGLSTLLKNNLALTVQVLALGINAGTVATSVLDIVNPILDVLDTELIDPLLSSLGLSLGGGDVTVFDVWCNHRTLVN